MLQDGLLFLGPCSTDTEPLVVLEFLHRVADALEEFLGAPLLASKLEANYDVIAQVLGEMCDGGLIGGTEANALRDVVDTPTWMGRLLGGVGLPGYVLYTKRPSTTTTNKRPTALLLLWVLLRHPSLAWGAVVAAALLQHYPQLVLRSPGVGTTSVIQATRCTSTLSRLCPSPTLPQDAL